MTTRAPALLKCIEKECRNHLKESRPRLPPCALVSIGRLEFSHHFRTSVDKILDKDIECSAHTNCWKPHTPLSSWRIAEAMKKNHTFSKFNAQCIMFFSSSIYLFWLTVNHDAVSWKHCLLINELIHSLKCVSDHRDHETTEGWNIPMYSLNRWLSYKVNQWAWALILKFLPSHWNPKLTLFPSVCK